METIKYIIISIVALLTVWAFQACKAKDKGNQVAVMQELDEGTKYLGQCVIRTQSIGLDEVNKIISDFMSHYKNVKRPTVNERNGMTFITLADEPDYSLICFWVNYIVYSNSEKKHNDNVTAWLEVSADATAAWKMFAGQRLMFFIPSNDTEYDNVYFLTEKGQCYKQEFAWSAPLIEVKGIDRKYEKFME